MNWVTASLLMFISSVVLYLAVRKSSLLKIPTQFSNLAMFVMPATLYLAINFFARENMKLTPYQFLILIILAIFFSYLGNVLSLKSIEYAPNPGYSLILSKSYVVFTTIVAIFIFQAELTAKTTLAILTIIIFSAVISINKAKSTNKKVQSIWLPLSIGAFFCWGMLALTSKYLLTIGVSVLARLIYSTFIVSLLTLAEIKIYKIDWKFSSSQIVTLLIIGLSATGFNYFMQLGYNIAPNIGYVNAVNAASISLVTIFAIILFKDEFSLRKLVGVAGVTVGLILLLV